MEVALALAEKAFRCKEVPVGAVVVYQGMILSRAHNKVESWKTPLAHAEILAVLQGQKKLGSPYLPQCQLYVTLQPCALCLEALRLCRIGRLYFGAYDLSTPFSPALEAIGGIQEQACQKLLLDFFIARRDKRL